MIADFHVKVWRHTYQDLAPEEAYAVLNEQYRGKKWREKLSSNDSSQIVLIAEIDSRMVGTFHIVKTFDTFYFPLTLLIFTIKDRTRETLPLINLLDT